MQLIKPHHGVLFISASLQNHLRKIKYYPTSTQNNNHINTHLILCTQMLLLAIISLLDFFSRSPDFDGSCNKWKSWWYYSEHQTSAGKLISGFCVSHYQIQWTAYLSFVCKRYFTISRICVELLQGKVKLSDSETTSIVITSLSFFFQVIKIVLRLKEKKVSPRCNTCSVYCDCHKQRGFFVKNVLLYELYQLY